MKRLLVVLLVLGAAGFASAQAPVSTIHDAQGWKLQVDGADFAVKGVVWDDSPIGENYTYDLFKTPDDHIMQVIDTDMPLLKALGVNTIRSFTMIPPRWIEYIFDRYGIRSMVNDLFGRYGVTVDGRWQFPTDYSNPRTRQVLLEQARKTFETYKDTRGVLLYMLGNESNYGLDWTSSAVENLPAGERSAYKAKALYSLFEEAIRLGKSIDPNHPIGLINGDLSYLKVIRDEVPDLDILGVNTYRGPQSYSAFYNSIAKELNKPFVYTEFGADAYNVKTDQEDQDNQARLIRSQWREVYEQAYGKGKAENVLGGYVFQWIDGWSKADMDSAEGMVKHDTTATWTNGGYAYDAVSGRNNMNEEWFGLAGLSRHQEGGVERRLPRTAYYLLKNLWTLDLYTSTKDTVSQKFDQVSLEAASVAGNLAQLRDPTTDPQPLLALHGSLTTRTYWKGNNKDWKLKGTSSLGVASQTTALGQFDLRDTEGLSGSFTLRVLPAALANDASKDWPDPVESSTVVNGMAPVRQVDLYKATVRYESPEVRATVHYHDGHPDWTGEGDFFGLLPEAWDLFHTDKAGSRSPFGIEMALPQALPDWKLYAGPELYWGAKPRVMAKYWHNFGSFALAFVHDEELSTSLPDAAYPNKEVLLADQSAHRRSSAWGSITFDGIGTLEGGALLARYDEVASSKHTYQWFNGKTLSSGVAFAWTDALAAKARFTSDVVPYLRGSVQFLRAGVLADTRGAALRNGSQVADVGTGNRTEYQVVLNPYYGDFDLRTLFLYRQPILEALADPSYGLTPRSPLTDEFAVWNNRKTLQGEAVLTWNPTGATYFHDWNNADREAAPIAASLGLLYNFYQGATDKWYFDNGAGHLYATATALPEIKGTWSLQAKANGRPLPGVKVAFTGKAGRGQSTGFDGQTGSINRVVTFWGATGKVAVGRWYGEAGYTRDGWGDADWYRQFNITYPQQWFVGAAYGLKPLSFLGDTDRIGVRLSGRTLDQWSTAGNEATLFASGVKSRFEAELYAGWTF